MLFLPKMRTMLYFEGDSVDFSGWALVSVVSRVYIG